MPKGPGTYGSRVGRPKLKRKKTQESIYTRLGNLLTEKKDWIKGAVNPAHKGYCTPMTKSTCTPRRRAFAKRAKKDFK